MADLDKAIETNPHHAMAHNNRGVARRVHGDIEGAIEDLNQAIKIDHNLAEAYANRGLVLLLEGDKTKAERDFKHSLALKLSLKSFIDQRVDGITHEKP